MAAPVVETLESEIADVRAVEVLRRGLERSPELRTGFRVTLVMALVGAVGRLVIPVLIQQILDRGVLGEQGFRPGFVYTAAAVAVLIVLLVAILGRATSIRLVITAEQMLMSLRVRAFDHIQRLSIAEHSENQRGVLTARVTSDIETLSRFASWGAISWIINGALIFGTLLVMVVYSWPLTLVVIAVYAPAIPVMRWIQRRQLVAYDQVRTAVGETLSVASEAVMGAALIRAYGYRPTMRSRLNTAVQSQYSNELSAHRFFAIITSITDLFGIVAVASVIVLGVRFGEAWEVSSGELIAFLFLVSLIVQPISAIGETLDQTQTALAGWWKILGVFDREIDVVDPDDGVSLSAGALAVTAEDVRFRYRTGDEVLHGIDVEIPEGANVAVVGETGSGKTTFAKLLSRLADPTDGLVRINGIDLTLVEGESRRRAIRMVPQDGFLFAASIRDNVRFGRPEASDDEIIESFERLGLSDWLASLADGLETQVGERGESLSVGERQLVALARAQLADPGLLILDEATSAVDAEIEQSLAVALERLSAGRTTVSVAHRLSTAERADTVLVFDEGMVVEQGSHDELVAMGGVYAGLHQSWIGATREQQP